MSPRSSTGTVSLEDDDTAPSDRIFQFVVAVYGGVLLAGLVSVGTAPLEGWPVGLTETYAGGFVVGAIAGSSLARIDPRLPVRLGRTLPRRLASATPAVLFVGLWLAPLESPPEHVALASAIFIVATAHVLSQLAGNRYVDAVTPGDPERTWRWEPPGSPVFDLLLAGMWALLAIVNAVTGSWLEALFWLVIGGGWIASGLAEGRWAFGPGRDRCAVQYYDTGLVKRRPYTKTFVGWDEIDHVRLRGGELVLDRGLRDVRLERDALEDPDTVLEAIDRRLAATDGR
ncbi:hypothetical protein [Natronorubrum sulfidifaciens]|uniref:hypothetical protein n=1 Tax=Natronorubrum sulfidifaciens TaxID=388259 RepID=UPI0006779ADF|nr:hypothetical protein [Natronorubrum sulfidifaciens]